MITRIAIVLVLAVAACGGSKTPPRPAESTQVSTPTDTEPDPKTCADLGGTCTSRAATVACAAWPEASDCGATEGCCVMTAPAP